VGDPLDSVDRVPRTLLVLRHGHAKRLPPTGGGDFERPLRPKGRRAITALQPVVALLDPDLVLSSPSARTRETVDGLALASDVDYLDPLYGADADELIDALREVSSHDEDPQTVLLVGHNPGVAQLVLELTGGEQLRGFPPAALAVLDVDVDDWWTVSPGCARLRSLHLPDDVHD